MLLILVTVYVLGIFESPVTRWHFNSHKQECKTGSIPRSALFACLLFAIWWNTGEGSYDSCWCHRSLCLCQPFASAIGSRAFVRYKTIDKLRIKSCQDGMWWLGF